MKQYVVPEIEVLCFKSEDVITDSTGVGFPPLPVPTEEPLSIK